jgi:hypothetical protein
MQAAQRTADQRVIIRDTGLSSLKSAKSETGLDVLQVRLRHNNIPLTTRAYSLLVDSLMFLSPFLRQLVQDLGCLVFVIFHQDPKLRSHEWKSEFEAEDN